MARSDAYTIAVGDTVRVQGGTRGWRDATVEKIGHKLVHISEHGQVTAYWRDGQNRRDGHPGYFQTAAQVENSERRDGVVRVLRECHGIEFKFGAIHEWSTAQLEALEGAANTIRTDAV